MTSFSFGFRLYDKLQENENASAAYIEYVTDNECSQAGDKSEVSQAYKYLANYYIKRNQVDEAYKYAHKCLDYEEVKCCLFLSYDIACLVYKFQCNQSFVYETAVVIFFLFSDSRLEKRVKLF